MSIDKIEVKDIVMIDSKGAWSCPTSAQMEAFRSGEKPFIEYIDKIDLLCFVDTTACELSELAELCDSIALMRWDEVEAFREVLDRAYGKECIFDIEMFSDCMKRFARCCAELPDGWSRTDRGLDLVSSAFETGQISEIREYFSFGFQVYSE